MHLVGGQPLEGLTEQLEDLLGAQGVQVGQPVAGVVVGCSGGGGRAGAGGCA